MLSILSRSILFVITIYYLILHINAQIPNDHGSNLTSIHIDTPSIPVHNDTSRDREGEDHDSEPFRNNGRGTHEANSQNYAAENNGTHGVPVEDFQQILLDQHNLYRRQMCANDLENDDELHRIAEERVHSEANGKKLPLPDEYNENTYELDTGDPSKITGDMIVKAWFDEHQQYDIKNESSATAFTQLVWKKSTKLGVGHAYNGQKLFVVALYKPSGNLRGQFAENVGCDSQHLFKQSQR